MERIPRVLRKKQLLIGSVTALLFGAYVSTRFPFPEFEDGFSLETLLSTAFTVVYFGVLGWVILRGLVAFQTLDMDREEIRVWFGPVLLRRIPVNAVRSVVSDMREQGKNSIPMHVIKLLFESPDQRRERGERPMLTSSFWMEDSPELRAALSRVLPRKVCNLQERL